MFKFFNLLYFYIELKIYRGLFINFHQVSGKSDGEKNYPCSTLFDWLKE